jgi:hypothetical protein
VVTRRHFSAEFFLLLLTAMPHALSAEMQERGNGLPTVVVLCNQSRMAKTKENAAEVSPGRVRFGRE